MAHPGGRPSSYHDKMPELLLASMRAGKSVVKFCSEQDISKSMFYRYVEAHPEFRDAFERGDMHCEAHWEDWLKDNLKNKECNAILIKMFFTNRFGWSDKKEVQQSVEIGVEQKTKENVDTILKQY